MESTTHRPLTKWERVIIPTLATILAIILGVIGQILFLTVFPDLVILSMFLYVLSATIVFLFAGLIFQKITGKKQLANIMDAIMNSLPF